MDYFKAKDIRKKGLMSMMTERLSSGMGTGAAIGSSISDRTKATFTGIKQRFDPLNIARVVTGGSKFAPAFLGALTGRSKRDIGFFTGKKPRDYRGLKSSSVDSGLAVQYLGQIYELLVKIENDRKLELEQRENQQEEIESEENRRNQALIEALTTRKKAKPTKKQTKKLDDTNKQIGKEKKKTDEVKVGPSAPPAPKPPTPAPTPKPPAPTPTPTPAPTPKPPVPTTKPSVPTKISTASKIAGGAAILGAATVGLTSLSSSVIAKEEGLPKNGKAYWDPPGQKNLVSIGYGHQIKPNEYNQGFIQAGDEQITIKGEKGIDTVMTPSQAQKLLQQDLPEYEKRAKVPLGDSWNKLNDNQKAALTSYAYNTGSTKSLVKAGLKDAIDSGDMAGAADIIEKKGIRTASGQFNASLDKRRKKEAELFRSDLKTNVQVPTPVSTGNKIDSETKENMGLKKSFQESPATSKSVNNTNISNKTTASNVPEKEDDTNPLIKKARST